MARPNNPHRKWTDDKVEKVLAYRDAHGYTTARQHFKISAAQLHYWQVDRRKQLPFGTSQNEAARNRKHPKAKAKGNGAAKSNGSGAAVEIKNIAEALRSLDRWKAAQENNIRRGGHSSSYDYLAEHALRVLRGEV